MKNDGNLFSRFATQFAQHSSDELLLDESGRSYTYGEVDKESARLARFLVNLGIRAGDRVSVQVEKSPAALALYLACLRGGFVYHPLNPGYKSVELEYFLGDAEPAMLVCDSRDEAALRVLASTNGISHIFTLDVDGTGSLITESRGHSTHPILVPRDADDLAALLYSSGTTGVPKGVMLSHGNLLSNAESLVNAWGFTATDRLLHALPIFHVHGLFVAFGCVLLSGASMQWHAKFDATAAVRDMPGCTVMMGIPTYYTRLLDEPSFTAEAGASIRLFISGSAPLLEETFREFEARTGHRILERYGMTETNMNTSNPLAGERRPGTVGPVLPNIQVRVVSGSGTCLAVNEIGHLQVRGPNVFRGYWRLPEKTADDFTADGWFITGDQGRIDTDGYVSIVGRAKDMVISGGLNVYPKEIELFIDSLPGIKESAVIGVPHADFGEAVVAVVVAEEDNTTTADDIQQAARTSLANFKTPKKVVFIDELPRNSMAKVQKSVLRASLEDLFV